ncbi:SRPBCC family protein [Pyxidicoccus parkwayensis]|uniref:SRPBCC family protein n=1 Tax=Pyxidicoccus parkwayensis TaxID=2813578 RepID=A0ABX7P0W2_9BACT|nr:SRPBCC family protein [Pyxidicoccus parkwaysis]QSQ23341.1 SRPBCC family protein [Pyxidicoccus parkwaysis]
MLKKILGGLAAAILLFVGFVATRPAEFTVQRSATLPVQADVAFSIVNDFHRWPEWSPWDKLDPNMKTTFTGAESGQGAVYSWVGNDKAGEGRMSIEESKANELVRIKLEFIKPFPSTAITTFAFKPAEGGTEVSWTMAGQNDFMGKLFCVFIDMDKMVGGDFERGLASMKTAAEGEAKKRAEAEAARVAAEKAAAEKAAAEAAAAAAAAGQPAGGAPAVAQPTP